VLQLERAEREEEERVARSGIITKLAGELKYWMNKKVRASPPPPPAAAAGPLHGRA
jgi:hypothetical protein